jgi:lysophospholipase L1-like esterase
MNGERTIVILGASYARAWQPDSGSGLRWLNRGVDGQQSWELLERFDADVAAVRPAAVIIWGFINDLFRAAPGTTSGATARAKASLTQLIERARHHGIEPVVATEITIRRRGGFGEWITTVVGRLLRKRSYQDRINTEVRAVNAWLRSTAAERSVLLLDFERVLSDRTGARRAAYAARDGSHISARGYAALTAYATPLIIERFGARA